MPTITNQRIGERMTHEWQIRFYKDASHSMILPSVEIIFVYKQEKTFLYMYKYLLKCKFIFLCVKIMNEIFCFYTTFHYMYMYVTSQFEKVLLQ